MKNSAQTAGPKAGSLNTTKAANAGSNTPGAKSSLALSVPKPPPRKGSFAEIMSRGSYMEENGICVGKVVHKAAPKLGSKERREFKRMVQHDLKQNRLVEARAKRVNATREKPVPYKASSGSSSSTAPQKVVKVNLGYKGTARPPRAATEYKGTARTPSKKPADRGTFRSPPTKSSTRAAVSPASRAPRRRQIISDDEDEEGDDGDDDDDDDEISDMEAGALDLEEEEYTSLRTAREEDEAALREEMAHKTEKERRKAALAAYAAKRRQ